MKIILTPQHVYGVYNTDTDPVGEGFPPGNYSFIYVDPGFVPNLKQQSYVPPRYNKEGQEIFELVFENPWLFWDTNTKLHSIRLQRDLLLKKTDWRAIRSYETGIPESQDWLDYRQALRDFPNTVDVSLPIWDIVWPVPPS